MIHFPAPMATTNFAETPPTEQQLKPQSGFRKPADYYSSPPGPRALPRWVPLGCGGLSLLILVVIFAGGAWAASGGFIQMMDLMFGMTMGEMRGMVQPDVTAAQKKALEDEIKTMREHLRAERISVQSLQPLLQTIQKTTADEKLKSDEVETIVTATRKVNATAKKNGHGS